MNNNRYTKDNDREKIYIKERENKCKCKQN